ncbi:SRPBCC family protein [Chitinophaga vietnamensis]|uniref:SRPBCC family protein n=1 Tax=Chitinophaga vietnamensis TaxID=2593957 RepID=UPI001177FEB5|nr:SRPBCC domain-containing protein [Chitinophaga vietnamensis]
MPNKQFSILINAPRNKVWDVLWTDDSYRQWAAIFYEGSCAKTDWKKGSKIHFVDSTDSGMVAEVAESIPGEYMSIRHLGTVTNGVENYESADAQEWNGSLENYTLREKNGQTTLEVQMDIAQDYLSYFEDTWPKALQKIKELAEQ